MAVDINKLSQAELEALIMQAQSRKTELHREELGKVRDDVAAYARGPGASNIRGLMDQPGVNRVMREALGL